ncbi:hypothetical protein JMJ77_0003339, partial [Colletotrichum scovillei]
RSTSGLTPSSTVCRSEADFNHIEQARFTAWHGSKLGLTFTRHPRTKRCIPTE